MKVIDLFAGAGGLSEGFRQAGYDVVAHVEMDESASFTLRTREVYYYLKEKNKLDLYKDYLLGKLSRDELYSQIPQKIIDKVVNAEISDKTIEGVFSKVDTLIEGEKVRVIIGGPPCQAYSVAGRSRDPNKMKNDPRNYLYKQYIKFLMRYQPDHFVFENVKGILSAGQGEIFKAIQTEMNEAGYQIDYRILNAKDFGVIQSRARVILIGWKTGLNYEYPEFEGVDENATIKELFMDLPKIQAGEKLVPGNTYVCSVDGKYLDRKQIRDSEWNVLTQHIARPNNEQDLHIYRLCVEAWNDKKVKLKYNELPEKLRSHSNTSSFLDRFNVIPYDSISNTIVAHISKDGHYYIHPDIKQNRSLSVREAARIQSFPDNYYFENSRTAAFRQIGNAVPPLMAACIAEKIKEAL
ncbi:DNA cytosine methyltransferase [Bacillus sp. FSL L8-0199]|uniref:DNA (cytosine-5-)-methyltransferase n=1 Tax=Bacillus cereus TaxID=1396 RepID=A0A9X0M971_BACCE|nr:DNA cytosine methyltransferase [Bacillus cereus]KXY26714.1 cytosine methyltransferase [Bacillus cereus]